MQNAIIDASVPTYTIEELENTTVANLKVICDEYSITYTSNDVKNKIIAMIVKELGLIYTEEELSGKTISELRAICDGLEIEYDTDFTEEELIELIIIEQEG